MDDRVPDMDETTSSPYQQDHNTAIIDLGKLRDTPSQETVEPWKSFSKQLLDFVGKGIYRDVAVVSPPLY
jgi:hypothetical protein